MVGEWRWHACTAAAACIYESKPGHMGARAHARAAQLARTSEMRAWAWLATLVVMCSMGGQGVQWSTEVSPDPRVRPVANGGVAQCPQFTARHIVARGRDELCVCK